MSLLQILLSPLRVHPVATTAAVLLLSYLGWQGFLWFRLELRRQRLFNKLPGIGSITYLGYLLGNIEIYYLNLFHLTREKAVTQLLSCLFKCDSLIQDGISRISIGPVRMVALFRADAMEKVINNMEYIEKSHEYTFFAPWLGLGLLTSKGDKWKRHRKLLTPAFHFKILDSFFPVMNENTEVMMQRFEDNTEKERGIDIRQLVGDCTLDTICETAMGVRVGAQSGEGNVDYIGPINTVLTLAMHRIMDPVYRLDMIYSISPSGKANRENLRKIHSFVGNVIKQRKDGMEKLIKEKNMDVNNLAGDNVENFTKKRYAFLDSLLLAHLQNPKDFTMKDIQDEVNTFMFEGHDTTSISLIFSLLLCAGDQRVQDKVFEELESIFADNLNREITLEDTRQMKYLELVIKESLRLYPSVPFFARKINTELDINGYTVPDDTTCALFVYQLHRDATVFPQPERFIPERFEADAPIHKMPYAYMPFSAGPRNCIGQKFAMMEMKILLASIMRRYKMFNITKRDQISVDFSVLIKADTPVLIRFDKR